MTVAAPTTLQESLNIESGDNFSLWRDVEPFPVVLHRMLGEMENEGSEHIISWNDDGLSFAIHKPKEFADTILTRYFRNQTRYKSFQRQLNLYRFRRVSTAKERAACRLISSRFGVLYCFTVNILIIAAVFPPWFIPRRTQVVCA